MKFSLILPTINRTLELENFLTSLNNQKYDSFELIIIDQNVDNRIERILSNRSFYFPIVHLKSEPGISHARNQGLKSAMGDIIAFPDDDCEYPPDLLLQIKNIFINDPNLLGITGKSLDKLGNDSAGRYENKKGYLNKFDVWKKGVSITVFLRAEIYDQIGEFDESLGLGAGTIFQSGEETDYLIRSVNLNHKILYNPKIFVIHQNPTLKYNKSALRRAFFYGCGCGAVLKKHYYPFWFKLIFLIRPFGGFIVSVFTLNFNKSRFYLNSIKGRLTGLVKYPA